MSQIQGDLLVLIVQANYRFSTKSPFFSPPKYNSVIVCFVCEFPHFFIILFRFVYTEKQSLGREQIFPCLTHFCLLPFLRASSGQIFWATPTEGLKEISPSPGFSLGGAACISALGNKQEPKFWSFRSFRSKQDFQDQRLLLLKLCSLRKGWECSRLAILWHHRPLRRMNPAEPTPGDMKVK